MKEAIIYYSYSGVTERYAKRRAEETGADLVPVKERAGARSTLNAYLGGSLQAMRGRAAEIAPLQLDWAQYDHITLAAPVWAGKPAPAINAVIDQLPGGKQVDIVLTSKSGNGNADAMRERIQARGCQVASEAVIKASTLA